MPIKPGFELEFEIADDHPSSPGSIQRVRVRDPADFTQRDSR